MSDALANAATYNIITNAELTDVLSHFNSDFIISVVEDAINKNWKDIPLTPLPNIIEGLEQNFKSIQVIYADLPDSAVSVGQTRSDTYITIIDMICKKFNLTFTLDQNIDLYSAAYILYDLFVSNFIKYFVNFFSNYIYKESNSLYELLNLSDQKKSKDSSTAYGKKIYKDLKLALINSNVTDVITEMCSFDISLSDIINNVLPSYEAQFAVSLVTSNDDFFKTYYVSILNNPLIRPVLISEIMFKLHNLSISNAEVQIPSTIED